MNKALIETLIQQKREIEAKLRLLQQPDCALCGKVKFEIRENDDGYNWQVAALSKYVSRRYESNKHAEVYGRSWHDRKLIYEKEEERWSPFIREKTKAATIEMIDLILTDLKEIRKAIEAFDEKRIIKEEPKTGGK